MARARPAKLDPASPCPRQAPPGQPAEPGRNARVWAVVSCIPCGRVATYRQIAALAGIEGPTGARQVGYALAALTADTEVPWHRVVNVRGTVSLRGQSGRDGEQYERLALEGVGHNAAGHIDLGRYEWDYGS